MLVPNSPLLLKYLCFGTRFLHARVKVNHRSVYSHILVKARAIAMATGLVKNKDYKWLLFI